MINLYNDNGYVDMDSILSISVPFIFITGARGTGKTYGALDWAIRTETRFILMRRMQNQIDILNRPDFNPFKKLNSDKGYDIGVFPVSKNSAAFYHTYEDDNGALKPKGQPLGYTLALSTVSNMRGFDMSDVDIIIFDEFIPELHERTIGKGAEAEAFFNAYETINRNRELDGKPALRVLALSNSNRLDNPLFINLKLVDKAVQMQNTGKSVYINQQRGVALISLYDSPISQLKSKTALYSLTDDSEFKNMALNNLYTVEDAELIRQPPLKEYKPVCDIGEIGIYKHKNLNQYYICQHQTASTKYGTGVAELKRFRRDYANLWIKFFDKKVLFESQLSRSLFIDYFNT